MHEKRSCPEFARANVLGVAVHAIDMRSALEAVDSAVAEGRRGYICVTGVHAIMEAQKDPALKEILNKSLLTTPDGMPTVWVGKLRGFSQMRRVFGPEFMLRTCEMSVSRGYTHFLYGRVWSVCTQLKKALEGRFPGLKIVGTYTPPFRPLKGEEDAGLRALFSELKPDICWVGLSTPKQERFMAEYLPKLDTKIMVGVGAAFDMHTGRIQDAPDWVKNAGLQWLHRLLQDPARLWRRYLVNNPKFVFKMALQIVGLSRYEGV